MRIKEVVAESSQASYVNFLDNWFEKNDEYVFDDKLALHKKYVKSKPNLRIEIYTEGGKVVTGQPVYGSYGRQIGWGGSYIERPTYKIVKVE